MPILDFDMGIAKKIGDIYPTPGIPVEFMPEELFERKRIVDKLETKETFSFISFWRSGFVFDTNRFDPSTMYDYNEGYYNDIDMNSATLFSIFPVIFNYSFVYWETRRETLDSHMAMLLKSLYRNPIASIIASDNSGLKMNCYMDFDYKLEESDEYTLEKEEKVPYFKGKFDIRMEGWLYDSINTGDSGSSIDLILYVHTFVYNQNNYLFDEIWVPHERVPDPGLPTGYPQ